MSNSNPLPDSRQVNNPDNWRDIDTSTPEGLRALDLVIARLQGYTIETVQVTPETVMHYLCKNGKRLTHSWNIDIDTTWRLFAPQYSSDANAAFTLIKGGYFELTTMRGEKDNALYRAKYGLLGNPPEIAETPALAICKSWLVYEVTKQRVIAANAARAAGESGVSHE